VFQPGSSAYRLVCHSLQHGERGSRAVRGSPDPAPALDSVVRGSLSPDM